MPNNTLFDESEKEPEATDWEDMPEFKQENTGAYRRIIISFMTKEAVEVFEKLVQQRITDKTKSIWYPPKEKNDTLMMWIDNDS